MRLARRLARLRLAAGQLGCLGRTDPPRRVIRGGNLLLGVLPVADPRYTVKVDYVTFRSQSEVLKLVDLMRPLFAWAGCLSIGYVKGIDGFKTGAELLLEGARVGRMDWGGECMRGWVRVQIEGVGCDWVDWRELGSIREVAQLRRCDPCVTFWDGSVTHESVLAAIDAGGHVGERGGRPPAVDVVGPHGDPWRGRTVYVARPGKGKSKPLKHMRGYEKGLKTLADERRIPEVGTDPSTVLVEGVPARDVYRLEVEYNATEGPLPWDMCVRPLAYWRGAYPMLAALLPGQDEVVRAPAKPARSAALEVALETCRQQWGPALYTALQAYGGDIGAVFDKICGVSHSERLVRAGALLIGVDE